MRGRSVLVAVLLVAVAPMLVATRAIIARGAASPLESDAPARPVVEPVSTVDWSPTLAAQVSVRSRPGLAVRVLDAGRITALPIAAGGTVTAGQPVVRVDDRTVSAFVAPSPLWRDVGVGTIGEDVTWVKTYLRSLGEDPGPDGTTATAQTGAAIAHYNATHGRPSNRRVLTASGLAWIGPGPLPLAEVAAQVGDVVGTDPIATGVAQPSSVVVAEKGDTSTWPSGVQAALVVGDVRVPYSIGSGAVTAPSDVAALAGAVAAAGAADDTAPATIATSTPLRALSVPVPAVVTDAQGRTCAFPAPGAAPVSVRPVDGGISSVLLPADTALATVLVNPGAAIATPTCA